MKTEKRDSPEDKKCTTINVLPLERAESMCLARKLRFLSRLKKNSFEFETGTVQEIRSRSSFRREMGQCREHNTK